MSTTRELFARAVRDTPFDTVSALVLVAAEAGYDPDIVGVLAEFDRLAAVARLLIVSGARPVEALRETLGAAEGFRGSERNYDDIGSSLLPVVLLKKSGLPILLSVIWVEVARRLNVPARCLNVPGHVLAEIDGEVVDPFAGGPGVTGPIGVDLSQAATLEGSALLLRVLANLRRLAATEFDNALALWATDLSLLLPSHPLELRRDRASLLVRGGRYAEGARELEAYAELAPPPADAEARHAAVMARARLN